MLASKFASLLESVFLRRVGDGDSSESIEGFRRSMTHSFVASLQKTGARPRVVVALLRAGVTDLLKSDDNCTDATDDRRVELIDASMQRRLSDDESFELERLTAQLREHCDTLDAIPMKGAMKLHRQLMDLENRLQDSD